ncbi:MAG TPA: WD40 repeat domain-containing protein [Polyangia bacterium]|nr:WD40 repeat domain-containing protein [Polyangia bacterium]
MKNDSSLNGRTAAQRTCLAVTLALLAATPACGDLDETDADPPSVNALAALDSSHLVAARTYYTDPVVLDAQSGAQIAKVTSTKVYYDVESIGDGELVGMTNQSIDFFGANGKVDETRSILETLITAMAVSADRSTLAWAVVAGSGESNLRLADLSTGTQRAPAPDVSFGMGLSLSRDGNLAAVGQGDAGVVMTHAPWTRTTCALDLDPRHPGAALATAFSPVADRLAVSMVGGGVNIFDLSEFPDCARVSSYVAPDDDTADLDHLAYSPDGTVLAISVEKTTASAMGVPVAATGVIRLLDAATASLLKELPVYQWQRTADPSNDSPAISDLQWSQTGDRLAVSTVEGPVQQWDVASGTRLWSVNL